jgi:NAD(P)-dependent dehydrogenase (short-subunit alcohol dehydrogenase family)
MSNRCPVFSLPTWRNGHSVAIVGHNLSAKVVVITGGARGIGAQLARDLVDAGASVAVLDRDLESAQRLVAELGSATAAFEADVTSAASVTAACGAAARHFGALDVVVANAGIAGPGSTVAAVDPADWRQVIDVNLVGVFHTIQAALPHLKARGGYVMVVASIAAVIPGPLVSAYVASKAGVESLVRAVRIEVAGDGVGVGIAYFGLIDTGLADQMLTRSGLGVVLPGPLGKLASVEAAAAAITSGIARRARRVYAPWWVGPMLDLRPLLFLADRVLAVLPSVRRVIRAGDDTGVS